MKKFFLLLSLFFIVTISSGQWNQTNIGPYDELWDVEFANENYALAVGDGFYFFVSDDSGITWQSITGIPGYYRKIHFISDENAILMEGSGAFWSVNIMLLQWEEIMSSPGMYELWDMEILGDSLSICGGMDGIYQFSFNEGTIDTVWSVYSFGQIIGGTVVSVSRASDTVLYASGIYYTAGGGSSFILRSADKGKTWVVVNDDVISGGNIVALSETKLFLAGNSIYKSEDGGLNWQECICDPDTTFGGFFDIFFTDDNNGYAAGGESLIPEYQRTRIYKTIDGGENWYLQYDANTGMLYSITFFNDSLGLACGDQSTIIQTSNSGGIGVGYQELMATQGKINAYPNPFTTSTTIEYELYTRSNIQITIYNVMGELIFTDKKNNLSPGRHTITLSTGHYTPGLYNAVLRSEEGLSVVGILKQ